MNAERPAQNGNTWSGQAILPNAANTLPHPDERVLDGYRLSRIIGQGGFGVVWLCRSEAMGDYRALKFITESNPDLLAKEYEALQHYRNAAGLRSPYLVPIEHVNRNAAGLYYVMPLADGFQANDPADPNWRPLSLAALVEARVHARAWFSSREIIALLEPILQALQTLSEAGLVHRDVKPDNILFFNGIPCLSDISLLRADATFITRVGTKGYAAPTWYVGGHPDMYGAAATLFHLLTGNPPDRMGRVAFHWPPQGEKSLQENERAEWKRLHSIIRRAAHERIAERYLDFNAMAAALSRAAVAGASHNPSHRWIAALAVLGLAGAAAVALTSNSLDNAAVSPAAASSPQPSEGGFVSPLPAASPQPSEGGFVSPLPAASPQPSEGGIVPPATASSSQPSGDTPSTARRLPEPTPGQTTDAGNRFAKAASDAQAVEGTTGIVRERLLEFHDVWTVKDGEPSFDRNAEVLSIPLTIAVDSAAYAASVARLVQVLEKVSIRKDRKVLASIAAKSGDGKPMPSRRLAYFASSQQEMSEVDRFVSLANGGAPIPEWKDYKVTEWLTAENFDQLPKDAFWIWLCLSESGSATEWVGYAIEADLGKIGPILLPQWSISVILRDDKGIAIGSFDLPEVDLESHFLNSCDPRNQDEGRNSALMGTHPHLISMGKTNYNRLGNGHRTSLQLDRISFKPHETKEEPFRFQCLIAPMCMSVGLEFGWTFGDGNFAYWKEEIVDAKFNLSPGQVKNIKKTELLITAKPRSTQDK